MNKMRRLKLKILTLFSILLYCTNSIAYDASLQMGNCWGCDTPPPGQYGDFSSKRDIPYNPYFRDNEAELKRNKKRIAEEIAAKERYLNSEDRAEQHRQEFLKKFKESSILGKSQEAHKTVSTYSSELTQNYNPLIGRIKEKVDFSLEGHDPRTPNYPFYTPKNTLEGEQLQSAFNYKRRAQELINNDKSEFKEQKQLMVDFAELNLNFADQDFTRGRSGEGWISLKAARKALDTVVDFTSGAAFVRDVGVVLSGYNFVSGETVSDLERSFALGGLFMPAATSGIVKASAKVGQWLSKTYKPFVSLFGSSKGFKKTLDFARGIGAKTPEQINGIVGQIKHGVLDSNVKVQQKILDGIRKGEFKGKQLEIPLDDGSKLVLRRDIGPGNHHPLPGSDGRNMDHYNLEIHIPRPDRPDRFRATNYNLHVVIDEAGNIVKVF